MNTPEKRSLRPSKTTVLQRPSANCGHRPVPNCQDPSRNSSPVPAYMPWKSALERGNVAVGSVAPSTVPSRRLWAWLSTRRAALPRYTQTQDHPCDAMRYNGRENPCGETVGRQQVMGRGDATLRGRQSQTWTLRFRLERSRRPWPVKFR